LLAHINKMDDREPIERNKTSTVPSLHEILPGLYLGNEGAGACKRIM
jgi:hypothetical protein